jgi:hypothetical protein
MAHAGLGRPTPALLVMGTLLGCMPGAPEVVAPTAGEVGRASAHFGEQPPGATTTTRTTTTTTVEIFREELAPYGTWSWSEQLGWVWTPDDPGYAPYRDGHWEYGPDGPAWDSYVEPWGDVVTHHGRWLYDEQTQPAEGGRWLWVPDDEWAPAWVEWRDAGSHVGWAPLPPAGFLRPLPAPCWVFVETRFTFVSRPVRYGANAPVVDVRLLPRARAIGRPPSGPGDIVRGPPRALFERRGVPVREAVARRGDRRRGVPRAVRVAGRSADGAVPRAQARRARSAGPEVVVTRSRPRRAPPAGVVVIGRGAGGRVIGGSPAEVARAQEASPGETRAAIRRAERRHRDFLDNGPPVRRVSRGADRRARVAAPTRAPRRRAPRRTELPDAVEPPIPVRTASPAAAGEAPRAARGPEPAPVPTRFAPPPRTMPPRGRPPARVGGDWQPPPSAGRPGARPVTPARRGPSVSPPAPATPRLHRHSPTLGGTPAPSLGQGAGRPSRAVRGGSARSRGTVTSPPVRRGGGSSALRSPGPGIRAAPAAPRGAPTRVAAPRATPRPAAPTRRR